MNLISVLKPKSSMVTFFYFIGGAIVIALLLVVGSMYLYRSSGAAQLDLSRPGYNTVRAKAAETEKFDGIASDGALDKASYDTFIKMYDEKSADAFKNKNSFVAGPIDDATLKIKATN